jgi:BirA family biotin operon repressor/biotin-[acetyl-CoA-carboxylase] ligase
VELKWPNDVMIRAGKAEEPACAGEAGKVLAAGKVAGILTETDGKTVHTGFGVNLLQTEFPEELRRKAASVALALGGRALSPDDRFILLEKILVRLFQELEAPAPAESWVSRLQERLYMRGKPVRFITGAAGSGRVVEGTLAGVGKDGELLILPPGAAEPRAFFTGELDVYTSDAALATP